MLFEVRLPCPTGGWTAIGPILSREDTIDAALTAAYWHAQAVARPTHVVSEKGITLAAFDADGRRAGAWHTLAAGWRGDRAA